jgi:hypothetical protein
MARDDTMNTWNSCEGGAWTKDERAQLHIARTRFREDAEAGIEALKASSRAHLIVRRYAGFEAAWAS